MSERKIGLREVRALKPRQTIWDAAVAGFGARRQQSPAVSYVLIYRTQEGRQRWHTIGRHGAPWTPETARAEAARLLGKVVDGIDPSAVKQARRKAVTVAELCDLYLADAEAGRLLTRLRRPKKVSTLTIDRGRIARHIKPLLGQLKVAAVTREDVDTFMHDVAAGKTAGNAKTARKRGLARVRGGKGAASRAVGLLGGIFTYAIGHRMRGDNPVRGVIRFADGKRERRLSDGEYKMLGNALRRAEAKRIWPAAVAAARFLALTGWRSGEALELRWADIDVVRRTATLPNTKTGRTDRPVFVLGSVAVLRTRSTSAQRSSNASPERHPVSARNRAAATAAGQIRLSSASRRASPSILYSSSLSRRSRLPSAKRMTPRTGLSARIRCPTA